MNKPRWTQWAYVEKTSIGNNGQMFVRVVVRKWHPGYWLTILIGYIRKYTVG